MRTQNEAGFVLCSLECFVSRRRLYADRERAARAAMFSPGAERHNRKVVLLLAEHGADGIEDANDSALQVVEANGAPERIEAGEKLRDDLMARHANRRGAPLLHLREKAALYNRARVDARHVGSLSDEPRVK